MSETYVRRIPELYGAGRLGRHVRHDPASRRYPFRASGAALVSVRHERHIEILDQGGTGCCTGAACDGALGTSGLYDQLEAAGRVPSDMSVSFARDVLYHLATVDDEFDGTYPPTDSGSSGLGVAKAAQSLGLISGYRHAFTSDDALAALVAGPVLVGVDWYAGFDRPASTGEMQFYGQVRGGHELVADELDVERQRVWIANSWGATFGINGRAWWSWATFRRLLASDGDVTVLVGLDSPAPAPVPVPADPDQALAGATRAWSASRHTGSNAKAAKAVTAWREAKGL